MPAMRHSLSLGLLVLLLALAGLIGPIPQPADYHAFADQVRRLGVPHAADVLSNIVFALVALYGWQRLAIHRFDQRLRLAWPGYALFLTGLFLTAAGSAYYHLAPDNARLVWDRLPIALASAGLLAGAYGDALRRDSATPALILALYAIGSVLWWYRGELLGNGDLRPYLLLQFLPLLLIPLWQRIYGVCALERRRFGLAFGAYVLAKAAEHYDHEIAEVLGGALTGHTLKHLLAGLATWGIVRALIMRLENGQASGAMPAALRVAGR